jgi:hypothetical protein
VGITQLPPPAAQRASARLEAFVSGGAYAVLLGSFQYSRADIGGVPLSAIGFALALFVTCWLAGRAMQGMAGALLPAIGWFVASFVLAMPNSGGSVIIANTAAGEWYLYGGAVCALVGLGTTLVSSFRAPGSRTTGGDGSRT